MNVFSLLGNHIAVTYTHLRRGMAVMALALAPTLWWGGALLFNLPLQTSLSAYYYTGMRDVFVGVLFTLGAFLFLYKGYTPRENRVLNVAGVCGPLIALFPTDQINDCLPGASGFSLHMLFASVFFAAIAYACVFLHADGPEVPSQQVRLYRRISKICGVVMVLCIAIAVAYSALLPRDVKAAWCAWSVLFWIESIAVTAFAIHWIVKSLEMDQALSWLPWVFVRQVR